MTMNKRKAARRRGDAGHRFSVARVPALLATALGALALPAWAQDAGQMGGTAQAQDETVQLPQVRVRALRLSEVQPPNMSLPGSGVTDSGKISRRRATTPDTTGLLKDMPGVDVQGAGGVSGLPVIHGLADERLRLTVDDMDLMAACANHMNPALSYIDPAKVESIRVYAGISPVSAGGDSIGGSIQVESAPPSFADPDGKPLLGGHVGTHYRSNGHGVDVSLGTHYATERLHLEYEGSYARARNYRAGKDFKPAETGREQGRVLPGDEVGSSGFRVQNHRMAAAWRSGMHLLETDFSWQNMPFQGFPNQRMDMTENRATLAGLRYRGQFAWGELKVRLWNQRIRHRMDMGEDRYSYGTGMPMRTRASTDGATAQASWMLNERDTVRLGLEALYYQLYDWWPPVGASGGMAPNDFWNIDDGRRNRLSAYAEWERSWDARWSSVIGLRHTQVRTDAGPVRGYNGLPTWSDDASAFNSISRRRHDRHWDFSALASYEPAKGHRYEMGVARKTRSPSLYERYPWSTNTMAAGMNNFLGDGNGYLGNPDLKPEVAHTLSVSGNWHHPEDEQRWGLTVSAHLTRISDYVDAERCSASQCRSGNTTADNEFVLLRYVNQDARLLGTDVSGHWLLARSPHAGSLTLSGKLAWLHGKNLDTGGGLYNTMPANLRMGLEHRRNVGEGEWSGTLEWEGVRSKTRRSAVRNEIRTAGYGLLHLRTRYEIGQLGIDLGIENLLDRGYALPLGGAYVGQGSSMMLNTVPWGVAVPGHGRSVYVGFNYKF